MSYVEAVQDGIRMEGSGRYGVVTYYPPCLYCGQPTKAWSYRRESKYVCPDCKKAAKDKRRAENTGRAVARKKSLLETAIERISAVADVSLYAKAITRVEKNLDRDGWYQTAEEIMVALELIRCGVKAYHHVLIADRFASFVLPGLKTVLEIGKEASPGGHTEGMINNELIHNKLGEDWMVMHISTECINMNVTKLIPAIEAVRKKCSAEFPIIP